MKIITIGDSPSVEGPAGSGSPSKSVSAKITKKPLSFDSFDTDENGKQNESLVKGKAICEAVTELLIKNDGKLGEPFVLCLSGKTGVGKTMLIDIMKEQLLKSKVKCIDSRDRKHLITQGKDEYLAADVIFVDDLFNMANSLKEASEDFDKGKYELNYLPELIINIYNYNKVLVMSTNFSLKDIFALVLKDDKTGRLNDRIKHLLSKIEPIELVREKSYREKLAIKGSQAIDFIKNKITSILA